MRSVLNRNVVTRRMAVNAFHSVLIWSIEYMCLCHAVWCHHVTLNKQQSKRCPREDTVRLWQAPSDHIKGQEKAGHAARKRENKTAYEALVRELEHHMDVTDLNWRIIFKWLRGSVLEQDSPLSSTCEIG